MKYLRGFIGFIAFILIVPVVVILIIFSLFYGAWDKFYHFFVPLSPEEKMAREKAIWKGGWHY
jgi:hypothetical protein